MDFSGSLA